MASIPITQASAAKQDEKARDANRWLFRFCFAYIFIMFVFLNYAAVLPLIRKEWGISNGAAGSIFSAYQIGYIISAVLLTSLTDRYNPKVIFMTSALWSALTNILFALFATDLRSGLILRGLAGLGMGGTYMPGLRLVADRFPSERRGWAVGIYTSAFVFGAALSTSASGIVASVGGWRLAIFTTAMATLIGALLSITPLREVVPLPRPPVNRGLRTEVLGNRSALLLMVAYAGHMWEQYGMRGWMATFLTASLVQLGYELGQAAGIGANLAALIVAVGGFATGLAGVLSDRVGRTTTIATIMSISALFSVSFGWLFGAPLIFLLLMALLYSFFVVAESPVLSAGLTELVAPSHVGAAMAMQTLFGFLAASASPAAFGYILDLSNQGAGLRDLNSLTQWGWAFAALGLGALAGPLCMALVRREPAAARMAGGRG